MIVTKRESTHKLKQTQTQAWSLAGEEAVAYSLARGEAAAVTRKSGEVALLHHPRARTLKHLIPAKCAINIT